MNKLWLLLACLPLRQVQITSGFGYRIHPVTGKYAFHSGIDLRARSDTVFAVLPGRAATVNYDAISGVYIRLHHGELESSYGHLSQVFVLPGDSVLSGNPIGVTGNTGRVTGEHLHFSIRLHGQPIDPLEFLKLLTLK